MSIPPLPREGARPSQVRLAAWHHAHRAHLAANLAADQLDAEDAEVYLAQASADAQVAQALAAVLSFDRMPGT